MTKNINTAQQMLEIQTRLDKKAPGLVDWAEVVRNTDNRRAPNIPNTVNNVPNGDTSGITDFIHQKLYKQNMNLFDSLNDIHRYVVKEVTAFVSQNKDIPIETLAYVVIPEFDGKIVAYDKPNFKAFLKLLTFFAITKHDNKVDLKTAAKVSEWLADSKPIFDELKLSSDQKKNLKDLVDRVNKPYTPNSSLPKVMQQARNPLVRLPEGLKFLRQPIQQAITDKKKGNMFHAEDQDLRTYLTKLLTYYNSDSDNAYRDIVNGVHLLKESTFGGVEPEAKHDIDEVKSNLLKAVKKHGGTGWELTDAQSAALKAKNPNAHAEYRKHYLALHGKDGTIKSVIRKAVRASGKKTLPATVIDALMNEHGLPNYFIPMGFNGSYDENSDMYTRKGTKLAIKLNSGKYKDFDPNPDGKKFIARHWNLRQNDGKGGWVDIYSWDHVNGGKGGREDHKAEVVDKNTANIDQIKDAWRADLKSKDPETNAHAHFIEAMHHTSSRISSKIGNTDGKPTYGMRTLLRKHVRVNQNSISMEFPGKKAMMNKVVIKGNDEHSQQLRDHIAKLVEGKKANDPVWTYPKGAKDAGKQLSYAKITKYLQSKGWEGGTHKFRHLRGNKLALDYIKKHPPKKITTAKDMKDYLNELGLSVGGVLGHKKTDKDGNEVSVSGTALKSYIDPRIQLKLYRDAKIPAPKTLENQALKAEDDDDDED